jgi:hypothetical protein
MLPQIAKPWVFPALKALSNDAKKHFKNHLYNYTTKPFTIKVYSAFAGTYHQSPAVLRHVSANIWLPSTSFPFPIRSR